MVLWHMLIRSEDIIGESIVANFQLSSSNFIFQFFLSKEDLYKKKNMNIGYMEVKYLLDWNIFMLKQSMFNKLA